jgi:hypothetical protein
MSYRVITLSFGAPEDYDRHSGVRYPPFHVDGPIGPFGVPVDERGYPVDIYSSDEYLEVMTQWIEDNYDGEPLRRGDFVDNLTHPRYGYRAGGRYVMDDDGNGCLVMKHLDFEYDDYGVVPLSFHDLPVAFNLKAACDWHHYICPVRPANYDLITFDNEWSYAITQSAFDELVGIIARNCDDPTVPCYCTYSRIPRVDRVPSYLAPLVDLFAALQDEGCEAYCCKEM